MATANGIPSMRQLAKGLGVSQPFLSQIKAGKRPMPDTLRGKVEALGCLSLLVPDMLITLDTPPPSSPINLTNPAFFGAWPSGRAPGLGPGGRQFDPARPDQNDLAMISRIR